VHTVKLHYPLQPIQRTKNKIIFNRALRYKLFFVKPLSKRLNDYNETIITITITEFSLVSLVIDYNEMIIISKNGDYNDYNKRRKYL